MKITQYFTLLIAFFFFGLSNIQAQAQCIGATFNCDPSSLSSFGVFVIGTTAHFLSETDSTGTQSNYWNYGDGTSLTNSGGSTHTYASCGTYLVIHCVDGEYCVQQVVISDCGTCDLVAACTTNSPITMVPRASDGTIADWRYFKDISTGNVTSRLWTAYYLDYLGQTAVLTFTVERPYIPLRRYSIDPDNNTICIRWLDRLELRVYNEALNCEDEKVQYYNCGSWGASFVDNGEEPFSSLNKRRADLDALNTQIKLYPTVIATGDAVNIKIPDSLTESDMVTVRLLDTSGRLIQETDVNTGSSSFSLAAEMPGLYILSFDFGNGLQIPKRIIVE